MAYDMTTVRRDPISRLDAWVIEELEALGPSQPRQEARPRHEARTQQEARTRQEAGPRREEAPSRRRAREAPDMDLADDGPLPMDENQFIQQVSEWLSGRPNADLILEEIWRNVVVPEADEARADAAGDDFGDELDAPAHLAADNDGGDFADLDADLAAGPPEGPAGDAGPHLHDQPQG